MEKYDNEDKIMTFMAMTECKDRNIAVKTLENSGWDEIAATNTFLAGQHQSQPPVHLPAPAPMYGERLYDDHGYYDQRFYGQDPTAGPNFEMPDFMGGIKGIWGSVSDRIFGCSGGKYFMKELKAKYPKLDFSKINFL